MSYNELREHRRELLEHRRFALHRMMEAQTEHERALWKVVYRWACDEIKRHSTKWSA